MKCSDCGKDVKTDNVIHFYRTGTGSYVVGCKSCYQEAKEHALAWAEALCGSWGREVAEETL